MTERNKTVVFLYSEWRCY